MSTRLTAFAGAIAGSAIAATASGALVGDAGTGYSPADFERDYSAQIRHAVSDRADFELGIGPNSGSYAGQSQATWINGDNDFSISYDVGTTTASITLNGNTASWNAAGATNSLFLHLIARNNRGDWITLELTDLMFNGSSIDTGAFGSFLKASDKPGTDAPSNFTYLRIDDPAIATSSWTVSGTFNATWQGNAPTRSNARLDASFSQIPTPGAAGALALAGVAAIRRRR